MISSILNGGREGFYLIELLDHWRIDHLDFRRLDDRRIIAFCYNLET